jgi:nitric oxide reductase NorE protein
MTDKVSAGPAPEENHAVPGEVGIWVFVLGDMFVFGLFFTVFVYYRGLDVELYRASQATLNQNYGALNTLLLLFSSWFVVLAVIDVREHAARYAARLLGLAMLCGLGFSLVKVVEYREKLGAGFGIMTNDFYMYYYIFTGLHFVHVIIGLGVLIYLLSMVRAGVKSAGELRIFESGAIYWHMVDLLWIVLFPLLYLLQ